MRLRINADDFGISPGVNSAIEKMFRAKKLHSASLICGCGYFDEAIEIAKRNPDLEIGLHFNITIGSARFKNGFLALLISSFLNKKELGKAVEKELRNQIEEIENRGIKLSHIDSHRHIHMIPALYFAVQKVAAEKSIKRVPLITESLLSTLSIQHSRNFFFNGNLVKWLVLSSLRLLNNAKSERYFFSILYTCEITEELIKKIKVPKKFQNAEIEVMIHPGDPEIDSKIDDLEERDHLTSIARKKENSAL